MRPADAGPPATDTLPSPTDTATSAPPPPTAWPSLAAARRRQVPRCEWGMVDADASLGTVGAVPLAAVGLLCQRWPADFSLDTAGRLWLTTPPAERQARLTALGLALREAGWVRAWRDEPYPLWSRQGAWLGVIERATSRFWGVLTLGAHANGYVADASGRPTHLWVARRAWDKPTDPGLWDNLVGGGVPMGQSPEAALRREAWEEAGLGPTDLAGLQAGSVLALDCDIPEGLQREHLHVWDLALPADRVPVNQDGEVAEHQRLPVAQALALAASGAMTVDASLATLDFAQRHGLLGQAPGDATALAAALAQMRVSADSKFMKP